MWNFRGEAALWGHAASWGVCLFYVIKFSVSAGESLLSQFSDNNFFVIIPWKKNKYKIKFPNMCVNGCIRSCSRWRQLPRWIRLKQKWAFRPKIEIKHGNRKSKPRKFLLRKNLRICSLFRPREPFSAWNFRVVRNTIFICVYNISFTS